MRWAAVLRVSLSATLAKRETIVYTPPPVKVRMHVTVTGSNHRLIEPR